MENEQTVDDKAEEREALVQLFQAFADEPQVLAATCTFAPSKVTFQEGDDALVILAQITGDIIGQDNFGEREMMRIVIDLEFAKRIAMDLMTTIKMAEGNQSWEKV